MSKRQRRVRTERRRQAVVSKRSVGAAGGLAVVATLLSGTAAEAATVTVTNLNPTGAGSLADAITTANGDTGSTYNTIVFQSGLSGAINLTGALPQVTHPLTITGPGANVLKVQGTGSTGIFSFSTGTSQSDEISGLTLSGGSDTNGGAIYSGSPLVLLNDTISGNQASNIGGAVVAKYGVTLAGTTISGNVAGTSAGGIFAEHTVEAKYSTIANNIANSGIGGGIDQATGSLGLLDSTVAGNQAKGASGSGLGGGIYVSSAATAATATDTIVFGNTATQAGPDFYTSTGSGAPTPTATYSLFGSLASSGITPDSSDLVGPNPLLGPLQNNGGPTPTMAPAFNSPVIDKGNSTTSHDQRGLTRPVDLAGYPNAAGGTGSDIGAVELQASEVVPVVSGLSAASGTAGTSVVISGSRLSTATSVTFGSTPATFTVNGSGQIVATAPAGSGTVDVRVTTPGGQSAAVAADQFTFKSSTTPPPPSTQKTTATFGNQSITLTSPSLSACVASTSPLKATLTSATVGGGTKLRFSSAGFFIDRGVKHTKKKTVHLKNGTTKKITVTTYVANVVVHGVPTTVSISLSGVKSGSHTLKVVISYKKTVVKNHKKKTVTVTKSVTSTFTVC